jgi:hypothetical protein
VNLGCCSVKCGRIRVVCDKTLTYRQSADGVPHRYYRVKFNRALFFTYRLLSPSRPGCSLVSLSLGLPFSCARMSAIASTKTLARSKGR